jgi:hypothetical protein
VADSGAARRRPVDTCGARGDRGVRVMTP